MKAKLIFIVLFSLIVDNSLNGQSAPTKVFYITKSEGEKDDITLSETHKLYVTHTYQVNVIDEKTGDSIGMIPGTIGVHGVALAEFLNKGYTSNGVDKSVTVFNLNSNEVLRKILIPEGVPDGIYYDEYSHKIYVGKANSESITVIDPHLDNIIAEIKLGARPEGIASDKSNLYVNCGKNQIAVINTQSLKEESRWLLDPAYAPTGLDIDLKRHHLFVGCLNKLLLIVDSKNGHVIDSLKIGGGCDGVAFDEISKCVLISCGEGTLYVVKMGKNGKYEVEKKLTTVRTASTIAINSKTHTAYLPALIFEQKGNNSQNNNAIGIQVLKINY